MPSQTTASHRKPQQAIASCSVFWACCNMLQLAFCEPLLFSVNLVFFQLAASAHYRERRLAKKLSLRRSSKYHNIAHFFIKIDQKAPADHRWPPGDLVNFVFKISFLPAFAGLSETIFWLPCTHGKPWRASASQSEPQIPESCCIHCAFSTALHSLIKCPAFPHLQQRLRALQIFLIASCSQSFSKT